MCRFVAYIGENKILLNELLEKTENSLISQSRAAKEGRHGLNADGFGLAWYDQTIEPNPGIFKSTQPAWNDFNLKHIADKIKSDCFLGHVRASTVGDVSLSNCHPFYFNKYAFVHNGTIRHFDKIRRALMQKLDDDLYSKVKGQTDSEHLFFLIMQFLRNTSTPNLEQALISAFEWVNNMQKNESTDHFSRMNTVITDGTQLIATRFISKQELALSLYYSLSHSFEQPTSHKAVIIASEPLNDYAGEWKEIPSNHYLLVDKNKTAQLKPF